VAAWLLLLYAIIALLAIGWLIRSGAVGRRLLTYGLLWLFVPIVAVLLLTSYAPKFNARYVMVALPGLLLILGGGYGGMIEERGAKSRDLEPLQSSKGQSQIPNPQSLIPYISILLLCAGFLYAGINWFT
jgi:hypothetical protein